MTFFEGNITLDLDSAEVFRGIGIFCRFFALKYFLSNGPLKRVWADPPTAVRFRVKLSSFKGQAKLKMAQKLDNIQRIHCLGSCPVQIVPVHEKTPS